MWCIGIGKLIQLCRHAISVACFAVKNDDIFVMPSVKQPEWWTLSYQKKNQKTKNDLAVKRKKWKEVNFEKTPRRNIISGFWHFPNKKWNSNLSPTSWASNKMSAAIAAPMGMVRKAPIIVLHIVTLGGCLESQNRDSKHGESGVFIQFIDEARPFLKHTRKCTWFTELRKSRR